MSAREPYFVRWEGRTPRQLFQGVDATIVSGERVMFSRVDLDALAVVPEHVHPHEQAGFVMEGEVEFTVGGEKRLLRAGDYYIIPGGVPHGVRVLSRPARCMDIFSPPREEYLRGG